MFWRRRIGAIRVEGHSLICKPTPDAAEITLDLGRRAAVNLAVWPRDKRSAQVSAALSQGRHKVEIQTVMPWSAVPPDTPLLRSSAPYCGPRHFKALWSQISSLQSTVGPPLPELVPGHHPAEPRYPEHRPEPTPAPVRRKARLRDMKLVGTRDAIFTFGINTRGFIVFGINAYGVVVFGMNALGVVVVGGNAVAGVLGLGFNMAAPLSIIGFNAVALLMLLAGFNDPLTTLAEAIPWAMVPVAVVMAASLVLTALKFLQLARDAEVEAGPRDDLAGAVIHRWMGIGTLLGAAVALALAGLLVAVPLETIRAPFSRLLKALIGV